MNKLRDLCCYAFLSEYDSFYVYQLRPTKNYSFINYDGFQFMAYISATNRRYKSVLYKYLEGR